VALVETVVEAPMEVGIGVWAGRGRGATQRGVLRPRGGGRGERARGPGGAGATLRLPRVGSARRRGVRTRQRAARVVDAMNTKSEQRELTWCQC